MARGSADPRFFHRGRSADGCGYGARAAAGSELRAPERRAAYFAKGPTTPRHRGRRRGQREHRPSNNLVDRLPRGERPRRRRPRARRRCHVVGERASTRTSPSPTPGSRPLARGRRAGPGGVSPRCSRSSTTTPRGRPPRVPRAATASTSSSSTWPSTRPGDPMAWPRVAMRGASSASGTELVDADALTDR